MKQHLGGWLKIAACVWWGFLVILNVRQLRFPMPWWLAIDTAMSVLVLLVVLVQLLRYRAAARLWNRRQLLQAIEHAALDADDRARQLLQTVLTEDCAVALARGYVVVASTACRGRTYTVPLVPGTALFSRMIAVWQNDQFETYLCTEFADDVLPFLDLAVARILGLRADEERFVCGARRIAAAYWDQAAGGFAVVIPPRHPRHTLDIDNDM